MTHIFNEYRLENCPQGADLDAVPQLGAAGHLQDVVEKSEKKGGRLPKEALALSHLNWSQSHLLPLWEGFPLNSDCDDWQADWIWMQVDYQRHFFPESSPLSCTEESFLCPCLLSPEPPRKAKMIIFQSNVSSCNSSFDLIVCSCFFEDLFPSVFPPILGLPPVVYLSLLHPNKSIPTSCCLFS